VTPDDQTKPKPRPPWPGLLLLAAALLGAGAFVLWGLRESWRLGDAPLGLHGWIAVGIAFVGTGVIGGGLMFLAFWSSKKGYDERAGKDGEEL